MAYINSEKYRYILNRLLIILLFIVVFDKLILALLITFYLIIQKYVYKKNINDEFKRLKKEILNFRKSKEDKYETIEKIFTPWELESEAFNNINSNPEKFLDKEDPNFMSKYLGNIFKHGDKNFNAYPNAKLHSGSLYFKDNKFLPECCYYNSDYSTSKGCPCITPEQQYYLQRRGTNKHPSSFIQADKEYKNLFFSPTMALKGEDEPFNENTTNYVIGHSKLDTEKENDILEDIIYKETINILNQ
jgi:hypothetical protein